MGHFYLHDGTPFYTVKGKNGKIRDVTLADARKVKAYPGVTTIIGQLDKYYVNKWKQRRLLDVVYNNQHLIGAATTQQGKDWQDQLINLSEQENAIYSKVGNDFHDMLEIYFKEGTIDAKYLDFVYPVIQRLENHYKNYDIEAYVAEKSFAYNGFGGCIDLIIITKQGNIIIDFKTKQGDKITKDMLYNEYCMQLAAYRESQENVIECGNLLLSATHPNVNELFIWDKDKLDKGKKMFYALFEYWKLANNYMCEEL